MPFDTKTMDEIWFRKTKYFWTPTSWQGWGMSAIYAAIIIYNILEIVNNTRSFGSGLISFLTVLILATIIFVIFARPHVAGTGE